MIRVRFAPHGEHRIVLGRVEIDGTDVSDHVTAVRFEGNPTSGYTLHLSLLVGRDGDEVEFVVDDEAVSADAKVARAGRLDDITALDSTAMKRLLAE